jgi:hypothetical protein
MRETCRNCGFPLEPDFLYCPDCNAPVGGSATSNGAAAPDFRTRPLSRARRGRIAFLVIKTGAEAGRSVQLQDATTVGAAGNGLVIADPYVSANHGLVRLIDNIYVYHDLASMNGSFLVGRNGDKQRITSPLRLAHGDTIEIGRTRFAYMEPGR